MTTPLTPLLRMQKQKTKKVIHSLLTSKKYLDLKKSLDVPKETAHTRMVGGRVGSDADYSFSFYNPHNARFYFKFNKSTFKPDDRFKPVNSGHELRIESFEGCSFAVKKYQIEIKNCINSLRKFTISGSDDDIKEITEKACAILELECIDVLKKFICAFGGSSDFVCVSRRVFDNKILHDEVVDSVPLDAQWNDDVSKKVYHVEPKNVEYKKPIYAQNYFRNAGLKLFAPVIAQELSGLSAAVDRLNTLSWLKSNCHSVDDVLANKDRVALLSDDERKLFSDWSFTGLSQ